MAAMKPVAVLVFLVLACFVPSASAVTLGHTASPVTKVVTLLTDLKGRIEADGTEEQKSYDKYACWCEDTLAAKATEISATKETIETLQTTIVKLKGELGSHGADIKQLKKDIDANLESQREATQVREKESSSYSEEKTESEQCIGALEAAIKVLAGAGAKKGFLETLQEAQLLGVVAGVRGLLHQPLVSRSVSSKDLQMVRRFVDRPEDFVGGRTGVLSAAQIANNPFGDYAPQSTQIQGILKGLYDSFASDLEKANAEEAHKQKGFEDLMVTKRTELKTLQDSLQKQTTDEADKTKSLADSKTGLDDAKNQLEADQEFFTQSESSCQEKASQWAQRTRLRSEELHGIDQAVAVLSTDEAKSTFESAATTLVQLSSRSRSKQNDVRSAAYEQLRTLATRYKSLGLARIAASVKMSGHFDKVLQSIDKMVAILRKEEQEDIAQRDRCEKKQGKNKNDMEDLNYEMKKAEDKITRLNSKVGEMDASLITIQADIDATNTSLGKMKTDRAQEHDDFIKGMKDDNDAVALIEQAIVILGRFKKNNKAASFTQGVKRVAADPSANPPATGWQDGNYGGRSDESGGIIAILGMIKEDLEKEVLTTRKEDASAQVNYEKDSQALRKSLNAYIDSKVNLEKELADTKEKIADLEQYKGEKSNDLTEEKKTESALQTDCAWVASHFESRRTKRKAEIAGLIEAKNYLAGVDDTDGVLG